MTPETARTIAPITVGELLEARGAEWELELLAGKDGLERLITTFELNRPGLALAGFYEVFSTDRIQLIGLTEISYLQSLSIRERNRRLRRTFELSVPCFVITRSLPVPLELIRIAKKQRIALLRTNHLTTSFQAELGQYLERRLAPRWVVHGVMVEVFGLGVLIQGKSGVGKSECGLDLVERGHLLIADDVVIVRRTGRGRLYAEPSPHLRHHMEIRGIGIIDVERLFGARSVREESEIALVIQLETWDPEKEYERLGLAEQFITLCDARVPQIVLPVEPGRNISQLIEVSALTQRLRARGVNVARDFDLRIQSVIERKAAARVSRPGVPARSSAARRSGS